MTLRYFRDSVLPVLTPLAIDVLRPFPRLSSLSLNLAVLLEPADDESRRRLAVVQVPTGLQRLVQIADPQGDVHVLLEDIIRLHLAQLFPGQRIAEAAAIRLTARRRTGVRRRRGDDAARTGRARAAPPPHERRRTARDRSRGVAGARHAAVRAGRDRPKTTSMPSTDR
ncbi:MAG: hypothetical protein QM736_15425 [Vicinamibacterales bacterium]